MAMGAKRKQEPLRQPRGPRATMTLGMILGVPQPQRLEAWREAGRRRKQAAALGSAPCGDPWNVHAHQVCACWHQRKDGPCDRRDDHLAAECSHPRPEGGPGGHRRWYTGEGAGCPRPPGAGTAMTTAEWDAYLA